MAHATWTGAISFGLVNVPVRLYVAVAQKEVHFHMLHRGDGGRIQFKRFCSVDGKEVAFQDIVKGFEVSKGRYVTIDPEELEKLDPKTTHSIEIEDFVQQDEIDPVYFDASYHVTPDERGAKAYSMLVQAMSKMGRVGIARIVLRTRRSLCALRPIEGGLMLSTLQYADEIVPAPEASTPAPLAEPRPREVEMAQQLIESLTTHFDPKKYRDDYRDRVLEVVQRKAEGQQIVAPEAATPVNVGSLADALAASLEKVRRTPRIEARRARPAARARRAKT